MLFNLGSGGHGLSVFCERFGPSFHRWWDDLGNPRLTPDVIAKLAEGVIAEENGRNFDDLAAERDCKIVEASRAINQAETAGVDGVEKKVRLVTAR
jgi:3-hydroxybutyryl-CoA dehydrogenase